MHPHPLDISDLRLLIAWYLQHDDLKACALVNKAWHQDFQPSVWSYCTIPSEEGPWLQESAERKTARMTAIRRNAHFIRHLKFLPLYAAMSTDYQDIFIKRCQSLVSMDICAIQEDDWQTLMTLVQENIHLQQLSIRTGRSRYSPSKNDYLQIASAFTSHLSLHELTLDLCPSASALLYILKECPSLVKLSVEELCSDNDGVEKTGFVPSCGDHKSVRGYSRLKLLRIGMSTDDESLASIMDYCPFVERLRINGVQDHDCSRTCEVLRKGEHRNLTKLILGDRSGGKYQVALIKSLSAQQLRKVKFHFSDDDEFRALVEHHYQSLESLRAYGDGFSPSLSEAIGSVFFRCECLKKIRVYARDLLDIRHVIQQPWSLASTIEKLEVPFVVGVQSANSYMVCKDVEEMQELVGLEPGGWRHAEVIFMKRLGQCHKLRFLRTAYQDSPVRRPGTQDVTWRLENGLNYLAGLEHLETLDLGNTRYVDVTVRELQFMKRHWPRLNYLRCYDLGSNKIRKWLRKHFSRLNLRTVQFC